MAPNVELTVTYGQDHLACVMVARSSKPAQVRYSGIEVPALFSADVASQLWEKLVPLNVRKGKPKKLLVAHGCGTWTTEQYDNVTISQSNVDCGPTSKTDVENVTITWNRPGCQ